MSVCDKCIHKEVCVYVEMAGSPDDFPDEERECVHYSECRPTGEWIPVSERVPEIATRCIVQLSNGYITIGEYFSIAKWTLIETSLQFVYPKETVTAWMPLPQPYKEGGRE